MFAIVICDTPPRHRLGRPRPVRHQAAVLPAPPTTASTSPARRRRCCRSCPARRSGDAGRHGANLSHYLTLQYVPEPGTLHQGIGRVGSGESFSYLPGGTFATRRYYQPAFRPTPVDDPDALYREIRETLRESVRHAHALRRAGRRVPVQRHRLDRGGRAGPRVQPEHPDLHRRLRRRRATPRSTSPRTRPGTSA